MMSASKSEYSLRTVAEQLEHQPPPPPSISSLQQQHRFSSISRPQSRSFLSGSLYSLRKPHIDYDQDHSDNENDDGDITPYATFTLKPIISGHDTTRSLMSVPTIRATDSHSSGSIEGINRR